MLFVLPVHLNPVVRDVLLPLLSDVPNVLITEPLDYGDFSRCMNMSEVVLTDSGGVQEEAPSLGKPVLVMRETTERPEAVAAGTVRLVGTDEQAIVDEVTRLLTDQRAYARMARAVNPYGDGRAAARSVAGHGALLRICPTPEPSSSRRMRHQGASARCRACRRRPCRPAGCGSRP